MMADEKTSENTSQAHAESEQAIKELKQQVAEVENQEGEPVPSQKDADETAATGI